MAEPFLSQIACFGFNFAPYKWAQCQGQILSIQQYSALFALLGTNFGGNGTTNFGLPNLQGAVPMAYGQGPGLPYYNIGETGGVENVTLVTSEMAAHTHAFNTTTDAAATTASTSGQLAKSRKGSPVSGFTSGLIYSPGNPTTPLSPSSITPAGSGQQHNNMQPYLALNYCIALSGIFPARP